MSARDDTSRADIVIAGAGMAGLAYAVAVKDAIGEDIDVLVCDPALGRRTKTSRTSAIAAAPRCMLETLGVWHAVDALAQPILRMKITDSRTPDVVRPVFLDFGHATGDTPYAHMIFNHDLEHALESRARDLGVRFVSARVSSFDADARGCRLGIDGSVVTARMLVAADGARSPVRAMAGIGTIGWDYPMSGIVATIGHEADHGGVAYEHFLPEGPFATLPLTDNRSSIVWTTGRAEASEVLAASPEAFQGELERRFGHAFGRLTVLDAPRAWPLFLRIARSFSGPRLALVGDAAHVVHPLAGQGINLGFRDVAALAEATIDQIRTGLDLGTTDMLADYTRARRFDVVSTASAMDSMNRLFGNDVLPVRLMRDVGLGLVDRMPALKTAFAREASGAIGRVPRLLRGEML